MIPYDYPPYNPSDAPDLLLIGASAMHGLIAYGHVRPAARRAEGSPSREQLRLTRKSWAGRMKGKRVG